MLRVLRAAERLSPKWRVRLCVVALVVAVTVLPFALAEAYRAYLRLDPEWRFSEEVILRPAPEGDHPVVMRWTTSPRIALVDATAEDEAFVRALVGTLNEVLGESGLSVQLADASGSNLQVYFATRATFDRLAANLAADPLSAETGFYLIWPDERLDIAAAVAVIGADLSEAERQATIVRQLAHSLGLRGDSAVFPESALFADGDRRSTAAALAPMDRKLLRLLYMNLDSADGWSELRTAYRRYWQTP